ncbi:KLRBF protein, partial [Chauna torquata]|nr:KLRBF protein [Chauna torquata]
LQVTQKALTPLSAPWNGSEAGGRNRTELCMISSLLRYFCRSSRNSSTAHAGCQLCPQSWQLLGDRCYRLSEEEGTWMQGKKDCEDQESHLAVLRNKTEEEYVNRFTVSGKRPVWIGLMASEKTWRWVDNSSLSTTALRKVDKGCGTFKHMKLEADGCEGEHKWVCQKEAFHFFP